MKRWRARASNSTEAEAGLSCAVATPSYAGHFSLLAQWLMSIETNVIDAQACSILVVTSSLNETLRLQATLREGYANRLPRVMKQLSHVDFPSALPRLSPSTSKPLAPTKDGALLCIDSPALRLSQPS